MVNGILVTPRTACKGSRPRHCGLAKRTTLDEVSASMTPLLALYMTLTRVAAPLGPIGLRRRRAAGKEHAERWRERLGHASHRRPEGPLVWFHGASVGESVSVLPLIERLRSERRDVTILVTTGTVSSARVLANRLPAGAIHQFVPIDTAPAVSRFLDHWSPDLAVWIESEIWPRLLLSTARRGIPALLLNARMSARSQARWRRVRGTAAELFGCFAYVQAQDDATGRVLEELGVPAGRLTVGGSLKGAAAPLPHDPDELARLHRAIGRRRVWVAASTHGGEEELAVEAHRRVTEVGPDTLLIIVPRHPERGDEVAALLEASGLSWARRADGPPSGDASVYLADTLGELGLWYRVADAAFVGGSTQGVGGHNPYEPVALDLPVVHGPDTANFAAIYRELDADGAARPVSSARELADAVLALAGTDDGLEMSRRAARIAHGGEDALRQAVAAIAGRLPAATDGS